LGARDTIGFIVTVRVFEKSDLPGILRMERECFDKDAWPREIFLEYAAAVPDLFLIASVDGRIAGYGIACLTRHGAEIASLAARPVYRRRGVATALLRAMFRKVRRRSVKVVWLTVRRENAEAIRLYCRLGFVRTGTVPSYYDDGSSGWRMRMDLRARSYFGAAAIRA
jgi:ribosomal-protein-alanine N-acetyltransferase